MSSASVRKGKQEPKPKSRSKSSKTAGTPRTKQQEAVVAAPKRAPWLVLRIAPQLRRDIAAVLLVMLAGVSGWGLLGERGGLVSWWVELLRRIVGWAVWLVPLLLIAGVIELFRTGRVAGETAPRQVRVVGGLLIGLLGLLGLLHLPAPDFSTLGPATAMPWWRSGQGGGLLGYLIATPLVAALHPLGAAIVLAGLLLVASLIVLNTDLYSVGRVLRRIGITLASTVRPRRRLLADEPEAVGDDQADRTPERLELPSTAMPSAAKENLPIINLPAASSRRTAALTVETIERPTTPRPTLDQPVEPMLVGDGQLALPTTPKKKAAEPVLAYPMPLITDLPIYDSVMPNKEELNLKAQRIEETLAAFRVEAKVREINPGAAVTQFALEPGAGVKVRSIKVLENDLALALAASTIAIETPIPGQSRVGIVIPNKTIAIVGLRETMESPEFISSKAKLPIALGRDVNGRYIVADLAKMPHLLIAGSTGSGKSVCINSIISTFLLARTPEQIKLVMIDPKMVELVGYNGVPHLKSPVVIEMDKVVGTLRKVLSEMERRYQLFSHLSVRNIDGYQSRRETDPNLENLPYLVVVIDELADLMMTVPDEVESVIVRLAQMARATGIHLIIATQRPSVDVLTGLIKANFPARIAFMVTSQIDSRVILDAPGADRLLGKGDMLFQDPQAAKPVRVQGTFVHDRDIEKMVSHWRQVVPQPQYETDWTNVPAYRPGDDQEDEDDPMMEKALKIVEEHGTISTSMLQRKLRIGYNKAARLVEQMEDEGIIGPSEGVRGRTVLGTRAKNPADPYDNGQPPPWDEE